MAKKEHVNLDGLLDPNSRPTDKGIPQRGAEPTAPSKSTELKRLSLALDGNTYQRLRTLAFNEERTHQDIISTAVTEYLAKKGA